ncbi:unnamed protein product, partial [Lymnaea stagnalis]
MRLFCFPFAGGNAFTYRTWSNIFPNHVEVCPVNLPGRAMRIGETGFTDLHKLTEVIVGEMREFLDRPFAIFGYSMGAIIGFEISRLLQKYDIFPQHLFVAASRPPQLASRNPIIHNLPTDEFIDEVLKLNGTPKEFLENKELFELMLPLLRTDFELIETYKYVEGQKLKCPIFAFGGDEDEEVSEVELIQWAEQTQAAFGHRILQGNHFFINSK